jgi:small subunit ribosomal protein S21
LTDYGGKTIKTNVADRHLMSFVTGDHMPLRMRVHDREPIGAALRRFKKLLERSGLQKELRKRKHYEKPCEIRRRAELRKQSAIRKAKNMTRPTP